MHFFKIELLAFAAILASSTISSSVAGVMERNVSVTTHPYVGDHNHVPVHQMLTSDSSKHVEERMPSASKSKEEINILVREVLQHFTPTSWIFSDTPYRLKKSDAKRIARYLKHVASNKNRGLFEIQQIEKLLLEDPKRLQANVEKWIARICMSDHLALSRILHGATVDEWVQKGLTFKEVIMLLSKTNNRKMIFERHPFEMLEKYIEAYNLKHGEMVTLLGTLADYFGGEAKLAVKLSSAKLSVFSTDAATEMQKRLLHKWLDDEKTIDDVFKMMKEVARKRDFFLYKYLDTFVEYVELLNENPLEEKTVAFEYLRPHFKGKKVAVNSERKRPEGAYHKGLMDDLFRSLNRLPEALPAIA